MKIGIVGCGNVGSASAYACVMSGVGTEIIMVDNNTALAKAQADDIAHATPFAKFMPVDAGSYESLENAGIVMITAGATQKGSETRLDLLRRNADVFADIVPRILKIAPDAILLVATNPVDIMTHIVSSFMPIHTRSIRAIGSGTILDSARFQTLLAKRLGISNHSVHAYVLGEHGDSEVLHWSGISIGNLSLDQFSSQMGQTISQEEKIRIDTDVRRAGYNILNGKGGTWYGVGAGMAKIAKAIIEDEHSIITCSSALSEVEGIRNVSLSLPHIISSIGIQKTLRPILMPEEAQLLKGSAEILRNALDSIKL